MNKLIGTTLGIAISIIVVASILVPTLNEATTTHVTFENASYYSLNKIDENTDVTIVWNVDTSNVLTINGEDYTMPTLTGGRGYTIVGSESAVVRYYVASTGTARVLQYASGSTYIDEVSTSGAFTTVELTISNGTLTITDDRSVPATASVALTGDSYYISGDTGDYTEVMKDGSEPAYVKGDSIIHLIGTTTPVKIGTYGVGTIDDGLTMSTSYKNSSITSDVTYSTPVATYTEVDGYEDLYLLEKFTFNISYDSTTEAATYSYFIVPAEVTAEKTVHFTDGENALLNVMPIMIIVAILMAAIGLIIARRD